MFFDKNYITLICSPDILIDRHHSITVDKAINWFDEHHLRYDFEERAAILEYDGGLSRQAAEHQAVREITERIDRMKKI